VDEDEEIVNEGDDLEMERLDLGDEDYFDDDEDSIIDDDEDEITVNDLISFEDE